MGIPITMMRGGMRPDRTVILYPNRTMQPNDQTTPMMTISKEKTTGVALRKNSSRISAVTNTAKGVACEGLTGLNRIGSSVSSHANMAVNDLLGRRRTKKIKRGSR